MNSPPRVPAGGAAAVDEVAPSQAVRAIPEWRASIAATVSVSKIRQASYCFVDQFFSVGGMFLANIVLARTQPKAEYGIFTLSYSVFTFVTALHNAYILEAFTIYGSGRYRSHFPAYSRLLWRSNTVSSVGLSIVLAIIWRILAWTVPAFSSYTILGMALTCGFFLTATFVRRTFYIRRKPELAAKLSFAFFVICVFLLWLCFSLKILNGFYAFMSVGVAWALACLLFANKLPERVPANNFSELQPSYWSEHWKYSRWVLVTALVIQMTTQAYYWLLAGFLSVTEVANLRAITMIVLPMDQVFVAVNYLVLPFMAAAYASHGVGQLLLLWRRYALVFTGFTICFAISVRFLGPILMHYLYAGKFDSLSPLLSILAFLPIVMGAGYTITAALQAAEKPKSVFYGYLAGAAATFIFGIPSVMHFGLRGAVYGMLVTGAAYTATLAWGLIANVFKHTRAQVAVRP